MVTIISLFNTVSRFTMLNTHQSNKQKNFKTKKSLNKIDYIFYLCICTLTSALYWNRYSYVFEPTGRFCWSICFFILLFKFCCRYFFLCRPRTVYISCCNSIYRKINVTLLTFLQHFLKRILILTNHQSIPPGSLISGKICFCIWMIYNWPRYWQQHSARFA